MANAACTVISPAGIGLLRVRFILASNDLSCIWFREEAPAASKNIPKKIKKADRSIS